MSESPFQLSWVATRPGARELVVERVAWLVYELSGASGHHRAPTLVFESEGAVRRVTAFPSDWADLPDEELFALSWSR